MKYRGIVIDVNDPEDYGRIRVRLNGFARNANETPWVWPCSPLGGPGFGLYCLPELGDVVWVERTFDQDWVYTGYHWTASNVHPEGGPTNRVFRTPAGHELRFDDSGDVTLSHGQGPAIVLKANGEIHIGAGAQEFAVLGESLREKLNDVIAAFNSHTHPGAPATSPGQMTGTVLPIAQIGDASEDLLSKKVKIE